MPVFIPSSRLSVQPVKLPSLSKRNVTPPSYDSCPFALRIDSFASNIGFQEGIVA